jgi:hypothetical protein
MARRHSCGIRGKAATDSDGKRPPNPNEVIRTAAIACGHKGAIDLDRLRHDPLMKVAVGRCPQSGAPLASQSTISRLENAPSKTEAARLAAALFDQFGMRRAERVVNVENLMPGGLHGRGGQQLAFWNAHHDERGIASMHIYHVASGEEVSREKPHPDLIKLVLSRAKIGPADATMIGDRPYDAQAAGQASVAAIGVMSDGFTEAELDAGVPQCTPILRLSSKFTPRPPRMGTGKERRGRALLGNSARPPYSDGLNREITSECGASP